MGADKKQQKVQSSGFTKEEELLLQDFSRNVSTKSSALFYGNAFIVSAVPICKCSIVEWHVDRPTDRRNYKMLMLFILCF